MKIMTEHIPAHDRVTELYKFDELNEDIRNRRDERGGLRRGDCCRGGRTSVRLQEGGVT